jgi:hypothetical protein
MGSMMFSLTHEVAVSIPDEIVSATGVKTSTTASNQSSPNQDVRVPRLTSPTETNEFLLDGL